MIDWINANVFPLTTKYGVELGLRVFTSNGDYKIGNAVTDYLPGSISSTTLFRSISPIFTDIGIQWHSHPGTTSLGPSFGPDSDRTTAALLNRTYAQYQNTIHAVSFNNPSISNGVIYREY